MLFSTSSVTPAIGCKQGILDLQRIHRNFIRHNFCKINMNVLLLSLFLLSQMPFFFSFFPLRCICWALGVVSVCTLNAWAKLTIVQSVLLYCSQHIGFIQLHCQPLCVKRIQGTPQSMSSCLLLAGFFFFLVSVCPFCLALPVHAL